MAKDAAITVRVPASMKQRLEARAEARHRSLSGQVLADLQRALEEDEERVAPAEKGSFLGLFSQKSVPTDEEIAQARRLLWGRLRGPD